ncbi:metallopeptidase family protein [Rhodobium gokarnense]|uniref:Zn-dependent protease with MMP-like domain n=1 Tax=Rhodobium gokarnense TaxID=364296 RepID=A0ABT3HDP4_9HYPH|nr:metallopeptidase family protein [Rhodobium gokarnense]MCW2308531.1 putative Zn-dependent protease with MMP-like domain [Rhodobium gokarnense]
MGRDGRFHVNRWARWPAPGLDDFEALAREAFDALPEEFRRLCEGVEIRVKDFPEEEVIETMDLVSGYDLLGLFEGIGLAQTGGATWTGQAPNRISLYRRPILDYWVGGEDTLDEIIAHVLIHEIGHHFGLSDDDMERIEARAD